MLDFSYCRHEEYSPCELLRIFIYQSFATKGETTSRPTAYFIFIYNINIILYIPPFQITTANIFCEFLYICIYQSFATKAETRQNHMASGFTRSSLRSSQLRIVGKLESYGRHDVIRQVVIWNGGK